MEQLPPFDALIAFEATARLGGMTRAAAELGVTQSAVSHRIRRLEDFMGAPLFLRRNTGLELTPGGAALRDGLGHVLDAASELRSRVASVTAPDRFRVGVGAALAENWLVRRLPEFSADHPGTAIELVVAENEAPGRLRELDVHILWVAVSEARASSTQRPLFREHVFPVCSPTLLGARFRPGDPEALLALPLLHKRSPGSESGAEWLWKTWFERLQLPGAPGEAMRFASIGPVIRAAIEGVGVGLARSMLVKDALVENRLVRVLAPEFDQLSAKVHVVRWPARLAGDPKVEAFATWLAARAAADGEGGLRSAS